MFACVIIPHMSQPLPPFSQFPQFTSSGALCHLLTLEGIERAMVQRIFALADDCAAGHDRPLSKRLIANIFFETSTRTRTAFEAAAKQLGADVVNLDQISMAGSVKQESLQDTVRTVSAMGTRGIVLRHHVEGAPAQAAAAAPPSVAVINGGDGCHAHPTQGLTDAYTLAAHFGGEANLSGLSVAIIGDVLHSRVARSNIHILQTLGVRNIRLVGPPALCPAAYGEQFGLAVTDDFDAVLADTDVFILLRVQQERISEHLPAMATYQSLKDYAARYELNTARLRRIKKDAVIMHPGPINRGVEIADEAADGARSLILKQIQKGMAIRMAVLVMLCGGA